MTICAQSSTNHVDVCRLRRKEKTYLSESIAKASVMVNRAGFQVCPDGSMRHASEATHFHVRHVQLEHREAIL